MTSPEELSRKGIDAKLFQDACEAVHQTRYDYFALRKLGSTAFISADLDMIEALQSAPFSGSETSPYGLYQGEGLELINEDSQPDSITKDREFARNLSESLGMYLGYNVSFMDTAAMILTAANPENKTVTTLHAYVSTRNKPSIQLTKHQSNPFLNLDVIPTDIDAVNYFLEQIDSKIVP
jgi:hypothetical protein